MSIIMTGGGTGGHLAIIEAVKEKLKHQELIYIGSTQGQDKRWFEDDSDFKEKYFLETRGVVNQGVLGKVKSLWMLLVATREAMKLIKKHDAKVVFSVGGFSSAATSFAAKLTGVPIVIHEQNAAIGSLNRLMKPYARAFISSYIDDSPIHAYPIKEIFFDNARERSKVETIIFLGGSQGAKAINSLALSIASDIDKRGIKIIHQAGEKNISEVKEAYKTLGIDAEVFGFTTKLASYMKSADFAIARAGASTLWELSAMRLPTLYIPYPYAASDHQYYNAKFLADKNLAWVVREDEISKDTLLSILDEDMSQKSIGLIDAVERDGSQKIADLIEDIVFE
ncbi:UDP-N-acetylglucosamine--N-acetylmuramyl-(pentapeptide) pyrophosphoryl-undecaprenol N-acetylglucosamine transferase [hydrothermal vent metagenome]|uniref:UDP-N-acetylglucosamine--N-acetylmuramyl-(Pentapeptide) pyrophosphoryl-undecaprenol N-acetylglucosamine transferase n=1 Tax=hydrothermal vent metagenome TaxID=652676 RepID=A0A1W1B960_9ZZZZ